MQNNILHSENKKKYEFLKLTQCYKIYIKQ